MTDAERMLLQDAIETAIDLEGEKNMWRRLTILFLIIIVGLSAMLIGGW